MEIKTGDGHADGDGDGHEDGDGYEDDYPTRAPYMHILFEQIGVQTGLIQKGAVYVQVKSVGCVALNGWLFLLFAMVAMFASVAIFASVAMCALSMRYGATRYAAPYESLPVPRVCLRRNAILFGL